MRLHDLQGVWRRSLIIRPGDLRDDTTRVTWVQGPSCYGDLRTPQTSVSFANVRTLRDLDAAQIEALAVQEGFAGTLVQHHDHFEWTRLIDFQPPQPHRDRGRLVERGDVMIEEGYELPYIEHWHRTTERTVQAGGLILRDSANGCAGMLVHVGERFVFARGRPHVLTTPGPLLEHIGLAPSLEAAQTLVDCEISTGSIAHGWLIERSTLPYRESARLAPCLTRDHLVTADLTPGGTSYRRTWAVVDREGTSLPST